MQSIHPGAGQGSVVENPFAKTVEPKPELNMKKDKSKKRRDDDEEDAAPKTKRHAQVDDLREMWEEQEAGGDGDGDERYDKMKEGKNIRRILPNKDPEEPFFVSFAMHFNMGPDGEDKFRCIEPGGPFGHSKKKDKQRSYRAKKCPACKKYCANKTKARAFPYKSKEGIKFWRKHVAPWRAKHRFVFATNPVKAKTRAERRKVFVLETGVMIGQPLVTAFYDENMGGDFTHPKTGRNVVIVMTKLGSEANEVEYKTVITPDRTPLKTWKRLKKKLPDLNSFVPEAMDPDAIIAIMEGDSSSDDADDDDRPTKKKSKKGKRRDDDDDDLDDIDDGDDDDDEGGGRREKLARRKRRRDEDVDPDAEEEDDEDSDDDDDDEKPRKKKGKKSKMRDKLKKKARRDDDDDDDSDDEGDDDEDEDEDADEEDDDAEDDDEDEDSDDGDDEEDEDDD